MFCKLVSDFSMEYRTIHVRVMEKHARSLKSSAQGGEDLDIKEAIEQDDVEGVADHMNEFNKWNIDLKLSHLKQRVSDIIVVTFYMPNYSPTIGSNAD